MGLRRQLSFAVQFARFCTEMDIDPRDLSLMIKHAEKSRRAYARDDFEGEQRHAEVMEGVAESSGLVVDWPGLWPFVKKVGDPSGGKLLPSPD